MLQFWRIFGQISTEFCRFFVGKVAKNRGNLPSDVYKNEYEKLNASMKQSPLDFHITVQCELVQFLAEFTQAASRNSATGQINRRRHTAPRFD